jgi:hypothetical protein
VLPSGRLEEVERTSGKDSQKLEIKEKPLKQKKSHRQIKFDRTNK